MISKQLTIICQKEDIFMLIYCLFLIFIFISSYLVICSLLQQYLMDTLSPKKSKSSQPKQQNILVTYDSSLSQKIHSVYSRICTEYAAVSITPLQQQQQKQSNILQLPLPLFESRKSLLTKRPAKKIHLLKFNKEINNNKKYFNTDFTTWLHYCDIKCCRDQLEDLFPTMEIVQVGDNQDQNSIFSKATKLMHLDFIWLGVGGRLGVSLPEFVLSVKEFQNFQQFKITYIQQFLQVLNTQIDPIPTPPTLTSLYNTLQKCQQTLQQTLLLTIQQKIEQLIIDSFSDHILVSCPTYHTYYKLLKTRNYFKLIWIQQPLIKRYNNFIQSIQNDQKYQNIYKWVVHSMSNFCILDDYVYQFLLQKCAYQAHFVVNTGLLQLPYREIIEKNYKQIFRKFRPDFDQYFISLCKILKNRSGCIKQAVGSIIVKNKRILATGYNGTPIGSINCYNGGCRICNDSNKINTAVLSCNCIHAEYSAIMQAGIESTVGCTLYTTQLPCLWCAKVISQAKISAVVYLRSQSKLLEYDNQDRVYEIFKLAKIQLRQFTDRERRFSKV